MVYANLALATSSLQYLALGLTFLGITWTIFTLFGSCIRAVKNMQYGVSIAAEGASYVGMGAAVIHMTQTVIGMAPIASAIHSLIMPAPLETLPAFVAAPTLLGIEAQHLSACGCAALTVFGCFFGKPR